MLGVQCPPGGARLAQKKADPITGNRKVAAVEASFGLGEALVSGLVNPDVYKVRDGEIVAKAVVTKQLAIHACPQAGRKTVRSTRSGRISPR